MKLVITANSLKSTVPVIHTEEDLEEVTANLRKHLFEAQSLASGLVDYYRNEDRELLRKSQELFTSLSTSDQIVRDIMIGEFGQVISN